MAELHFLRPLWFLALLPLPWVLWRLRPGRSASAWQKVVDAHLLEPLLEKSSAHRQIWPQLLLGLGWVLAVIALAGPVWERLPQPVFTREAFRVILLDLSPEMNAQDIRPSRLVRARYEVLDLLQQAREGQTALLVYGAEPFLVSPLTWDAKTIAAQVPQLVPDLLPVQGPKRTDLALAEAGKLLHQAGAPRGEILLITGSMPDLETARAAAEKLRAAGYRVSVLGVGTEEGAPIPQASGGFLKDAQGGIRLAHLQTEALQALASAGGGRFVGLRADDGDTQALLAAAPRSDARKEAGMQADQWREEGPWLLLLLLPLATLAFRRGWLGALLLAVLYSPVPKAQAFDWASLWWRPDQQGARAFSREQYDQAAAQFQRPDWRAAAQYRSGHFAEALHSLKGLPGAEAAYNRGNALAHLGKLKAAVEQYEQALREDPENADAQHNLELVRKLLEQQQSQQGGSQQKPEENPQASDQPEQNDASQSQGKKDQSQNASQENTDSGQDQSTGEESQSGDAQQDRQNAAQPPQKPSKDAQQSPSDEGAAKQAQSGQDHQSAQNSPEAQPQHDPDRTEDRQLGGEPNQKDLLGGESEPDAPAKTQSQPASKNPADREASQAMEQLLRRVPDDPGGLLRQRFLLQHLRRTGQLKNLR